MSKLLSVFLALTIGIGAMTVMAFNASAANPIDITEKFTDLNFRAAVYAQIGKTAPKPIYDTDAAEIGACFAIGESIRSIAGIEYLTSLMTLGISNTQITVLPDLPSTLTHFVCTDNQQLTALPALPSGIIELICRNNPLLTALPALPSELRYLDCRYNQLTALPELPSGLGELICSYNQITALPRLPSELRHLKCDNNQLTCIDATNSQKLVALRCWNNNMKQPCDVTGYTFRLYEPGEILFGRNGVFYPQNGVGIYGTNAKWDGSFGHRALYFLCFGWIWMWF